MTEADRRSSFERGPDVLDGDASMHLEELVVGDLPAIAHDPAAGIEIELLGPHLRVTGSLNTGQHRRLSDFINHHEGLMAIRDVTVLRRNGEPTKVTTPSMWVSPHEVTLIGQAQEGPALRSLEMQVEKDVSTVIIVTPGHTLTGQVHLMPEALLAHVIESDSPPFLPLTDVRTRSLADRRVITRYPFALLNRRHLVAATELRPGMQTGRRVL